MSVQSNVIDLNMIKKSVNTLLHKLVGNCTGFVQDIISFEENFSDTNKITEIYVCYTCDICNEFVYKGYKHCPNVVIKSCEKSYKRYVLTPHHVNYKDILEQLHCLYNINCIINISLNNLNSNDPNSNNFGKNNGFIFRINNVEYMINIIDYIGYINDLHNVKKENKDISLSDKEKEQLIIDNAIFNYKIKLQKDIHDWVTNNSDLIKSVEKLFKIYPYNCVVETLLYSTIATFICSKI